MLSRACLFEKYVRLSLDSQKVRAFLGFNGDASCPSGLAVGACGLDDSDLDRRVPFDRVDGFFDLLRDFAFNAIHGEGHFCTISERVSAMITT